MNRESLINSIIEELDGDPVRIVEFNNAIETLDKMSEEDRHRVFCAYCSSCGSTNIKCKCWNDE